MDKEGHGEILRSLGRIEGKIEGILEQATKTNGRVTRLEESVTTLKVDDGVTTTKVSIIGAVMGAAGGYLISLLK